jgi:hypothetical protein
VIALLLDLANVLGGFLLAIPLLTALPRAGDDLARIDRALRPYAWIVGVIALAAGGYYLIEHLISGPHVFHFEVVGIGVGLALLWHRLTGRAAVTAETSPAPSAGGGPAVQGAALLLAVFGIIAILVGFQGFFTPN